MPTTYQPADFETLELIESVKRRFHPVLLHAEVRIDVLMADNGLFKPAIKVGGYPAAACVSIVPLKQRALDRGDALLVIDQAIWARLHADERDALLDHELEHIQVKAEKPLRIVQAIGELGVDKPLEEFQFIGTIDRDDLRRPKLKLKLHDWQLGGFRSVASRHHEAAPEVKAIRACRHETTGQYFWDFDTGSGATVAQIDAARKKRGRKARKSEPKAAE